MGALGNLGEDAVELFHLAGAADHRAQPLREAQPLAQLAGGGVGDQRGGGAVQNGGQFIHGEGLGQVVRGSAAHRLDGGVDRARGGHRDHRGLRVEQLDLGDQLQALVRARGQVDQQDVGGAAAQHAARLSQVAGALHRVAQAGGNLGAGRADRGVGVDHQQVQASGRFRELLGINSMALVFRTVSSIVLPHAQRVNGIFCLLSRAFCRPGTSCWAVCRAGAPQRERTGSSISKRAPVKSRLAA
jgi:hypothetical protein